MGGINPGDSPRATPRETILNIPAAAEGAVVVAMAVPVVTEGIVAVAFAVSVVTGSVSTIFRRNTK